MNWSLDFVSREDFKNHVANTIKTYDNTLNAIDLKTFNSNIIDPIKLTFDSKVYNKDLEEVIENELVRQRDKTNTNAIGYFHQNLFKYIKNCEVPDIGFDVVYTRNDGTKVYVEMKNKHNTMNSSASQKTYLKMTMQLLDEDNCDCYLVEIIAKKSQNIIWSISLDYQKTTNENIRRVSIDKFYEEVTGNRNAFYLICKELPSIIDEIINENEELSVDEDTVIKELKEKNPDILKSLYILAFSTYEGFKEE
ncbi:MAG: Eco47II family restriction endonuclease [Bacilli bacterium]|nr:Eco47II family restriction endonuclease [Bacilli bacterium]MDD4795923.1 Eco47II family restriction endonuclease [Bacilli bacterium]